MGSSSSTATPQAPCLRGETSAPWSANWGRCARTPRDLSPRRREDLRGTVGDLLRSQLDLQWARLPPHFPLIARMVLLRTIDENWRQHPSELDEVREGVGLRGYGGTDSLVGFKCEAHRLCQVMIVRAEEEALRFLLDPGSPCVLGPRRDPPLRRAPVSSLSCSSTTSSTSGPFPARPATSRGASDRGKVSRSAPCPCGSGK